MIINPKVIKFILFKWNHFTNPEVNIIAPNEAVKGQGLFSTKWYGWFVCIDIIN
jgi:hypothetical protein